MLAEHSDAPLFTDALTGILEQIPKMSATRLRAWLVALTHFCVGRDAR
jgi:hypothetical protein